jgi:hypothetical protein
MEWDDLFLRRLKEEELVTLTSFRGVFNSHNIVQWTYLKPFKLREGTHDHLYGQARSCGERVKQVRDRNTWKKEWVDLNLSPEGVSIVVMTSLAGERVNSGQPSKLWEPQNGRCFFPYNV